MQYSDWERLRDASMVLANMANDRAASPDDIARKAQEVLALALTVEPLDLCPILLEIQQQAAQAVQQLRAALATAEAVLSAATTAYQRNCLDPPPAPIDADLDMGEPR